MSESNGSATDPERVATLAELGTAVYKTGHVLVALLVLLWTPFLDVPATGELNLAAAGVTRLHVALLLLAASFLWPIVLLSATLAASLQAAMIVGIVSCLAVYGIDRFLAAKTLREYEERRRHPIHRALVRLHQVVVVASLLSIVGVVVAASGFKEQGREIRAR